MSTAPQAEWGRQLKARRKELGLSLAQVTQAAGISKQYWCRLEAGQANPTADVWLRVAAAVDSEIGFFVRGQQ